ncbi:MAG: hypothetical protein AB1938_26510 [Myxococcota bacterium]
MRRTALLVVLVAGCARGPSRPTVDTLAGLTLPLKPGPGLRLWLEGKVGDVDADVQLDVTAPISFVTPFCLDEKRVVAHVEVDDPLGPTESFPVSRVNGLTLGGARLRSFDAALAGGKGCVVVLGADVLGALAIDVSPARREVTLRPSQSRAAWEAEVQAQGVEAQLLALTRDPTHDWPLLPIRLTQGPRVVTWSVLLSSRDARSRLFVAAAEEADLRLGRALLDGLVPDGGVLPEPLQRLSGVAYELLELSPGFGVTDGILELEPGAPPHGVAGLLGADVWGRFDVAIDLKAGLLVLRRPRVFTSGARAQCERGGPSSEDRCFELHSRRDARGTLVATATVWRQLPEGARLLLDVPNAAKSRCRVGFTFPPGDRGRSAQHAFPWDRLVQSLPECAATLAAAPDVAFGLYEEEPMRECPGLCAFAHDLNSGHITCECQPGPAGLDGVSEHQVLELYRRAMQKGPAAQDVEPADP